VLAIRKHKEKKLDTLSKSQTRFIITLNYMREKKWCIYQLPIKNGAADRGRAMHSIMRQSDAGSDAKCLQQMRIAAVWIQ
jgi:hypothetical protein